MKIKSIKLYNHKILGDIELNFTKDGKVSDTVVFAGENGSGKTILLDLIYEIGLLGPRKDREDERREIIFEVSESDLLILRSDEKIGRLFKSEILNNEIYMNLDFSLPLQWKQYYTYIVDMNGNKQAFDAMYLNTPNLKKLFFSIYSRTEINFLSEKISSTTTQDIDASFSGSVQSSTDLARQISQLIIDIHQLDNGELSAWVDENPGEPPPDNVKRQRMRRFENAFNSMFPYKSLKGVENIEGKKEIIFLEHGRRSSINHLSTGEKQIVFRGGFLLKDINSSRGALILIDEPEISLHPTWQQKILSFYQNLFINSESNQTSQIFVATHSPFLLQSAENCSVCIFKKDLEGRINVTCGNDYYGWTPDQLSMEAFGLETLRPKAVDFDIKRLRQFLVEISEGIRNENDPEYINLRAKLEDTLIDGDHELIGIEVLNTLRKKLQ